MSCSLTQRLAPGLLQAGVTEIHAITPLTEGLSNSNYYVQGRHSNPLAGTKWVLRLNSHASSAICDRRSEVEIWRQVSQAKLAPNIVYISPDHRFYLSEYLEQTGTKRWNQLLCERSAVADEQASIWPDAEHLLLSLLNGLSALSPQAHVITLRQQWQIYNRRLTAMQQQLRSNDDHPLTCQWQQQMHCLTAQSDNINRLLLTLEHCCIRQQFSHRDLNPQNILRMQDRLYCIDFEYACRSHPLCDLASVLSSHALSSSQRDWLIDHYLSQNQNLNQHAKAAVPAAIDLYWVFAVSWALQMAFDNMQADQVNTMATNMQQVETYLRCAKEYQALMRAG